MQMITDLLLLLLKINMFSIFYLSGFLLKELIVYNKFTLTDIICITLA